MPSVQSYVLCATPRSGSTLLCDLLESSGAAGRPASYFRRQSVPNWARRLSVPAPGDAPDIALDRPYLDAVLEAGAAGTGVFGLRLMWESVADLSARLDALYPGLGDDRARFEAAFGSTLFIHLSREDKAAQAVSRLKAVQTGLWHVAADGAERERTAPPQPAVYDRDRIATLVAELASDDAAWRRWFESQGVAPLRLTYEALSEAPAKALATVLAALDLDPAIADAVAPRTAKMADLESREWAARFRMETAPPD